MGAVEWSLYPYREANRRQLMVAYRLGASDITYRDSTTFDETAQRLGQHVLDAGCEVVQPWGEVEVGVDASRYLHGPSLYSVQSDAEVRTTRGLSVGVGGFSELIQDQVNLPKGDADLEEVLLRRRPLATDREAGLRFGVRYRFGSLFDNVVDPRLGGVGNRDRLSGRAAPLRSAPRGGAEDAAERARPRRHRPHAERRRVGARWDAGPAGAVGRRRSARAPAGRPPAGLER